MKKSKKFIKTAMGMAVLMALLGGCAHTSQSEEQSSIDYGSIPADTQMAKGQEETNIDAEDVQNAAVFIDEKLDENLFISAELKMTENNLYEYATQLKSFDQDKVQEAIGQNGEGILVVDVVAMDQADFENVKKAIMEDDSYQFLSAKGYGNDTFEEGMEVYRMIFQMNVNGIPVYRNEPNLRQSSERFLAYPAVVTAVISNHGMEMITMMGTFEPYEEHQKEAAVIGEEGIKEAIMKKFGDMTLAAEFRAKNIWMEYFPLLREDSFMEMDLISVWCVDFEVDGKSVGDSRYSIRFNAITGEEIS